MAADADDTHRASPTAHRMGDAAPDNAGQAEAEGAVLRDAYAAHAGNDGDAPSAQVRFGVAVDLRRCNYQFLARCSLKQFLCAYMSRVRCVRLKSSSNPDQSRLPN